MMLGIIVQARMSSKRLPNKVLALINGKPLLQHLVEGIKKSKLIKEIIIATSIEDSDNSIADFCINHNIKCYRGALDDVASRFKDILNNYFYDGFVRINADSPLLDYRLIDQAVKIFLNGNYDLVTNVFPRSFPVGQSVEVLKTETFLDGYTLFTEKNDFEHVTKYFYRNHEKFKIYNFSYKKDFSNLSFAVDTSSDFERVNKIMSYMKAPHWNYNITDLIGIYQELDTNSMSVI